jgi:hypothetical protein
MVAQAWGQRLQESQSAASLGKRLMRPHLNQWWLGLVVRALQGGAK